MKLNNIKSFKLGSEIKGFFLCHQKYLKTTRFGDPFIDLILKDSTGSIRGKIWSQVQYFASKFEKGDIVAVKGIIVKFNNGNEVSLSFINNASQDFYVEYGYNPNMIIGKINKPIKQLYAYILKVINSLSSDHKSTLLNLYTKNKAKFQTIPIEKRNYYLNGGYLLFIYNLLNNYNNIFKRYKKLDREKVLVCILLTHIGYIHYFNDERIFSISNRGKILGCKILGINILLDSIPKNINESNKNFYQQCIMMDKNSEDRNIRFVNSLINLEDIAG